MNRLTYIFTVFDDDAEMIYTASSSTLDLLEEKIGTFERHFKNTIEEAEEDFDDIARAELESVERENIMATK